VKVILATFIPWERVHSTNGQGNKWTLEPYGYSGKEKNPNHTSQESIPGHPANSLLFIEGTIYTGTQHIINYY
jgi:hypothetical protein